MSSMEREDLHRGYIAQLRNHHPAPLLDIAVKPNQRLAKRETPENRQAFGHTQALEKLYRKGCDSGCASDAFGILCPSDDSNICRSILFFDSW